MRCPPVPAAGRTCGADVANLHFLDMPFYQTGVAPEVIAALPSLTACRQDGDGFVPGPLDLPSPRLTDVMLHCCLHCLQARW